MAQGSERIGRKSPPSPNLIYNIKKNNLYVKQLIITCFNQGENQYF